MSIKNNQANQVISRLMEIYKVSSDKELATHINVSAQTISTWRQRDSTPFEMCLKVSSDFDVDLNWLLKGQGSMCKNRVKEESPSYQTKSICDLEGLFDRVESLEEQIRELRKKA